ncbi:ABC transporter ATP-binding protein [Marivirga sp. S37H4]|uniref:ABC transporter ATP-binding protein n=2 Tax=Marivirga aurantiaca TaxID=2802615 RepID=A0A935CCD8_9BACT|nr:ABC transporter ATP-binding protein [Marivirga aurantiaca]MBK6265963.1 ABC transporter ATP-binding protein [Marivirga aurantiaca]
MNSLVLQNITKIYPNGVNALKGVSLELGNGMFGLLGPNGAGKSTLMRTIAALQSPNEGRIFFNGTDTIRNPQFMRNKLGYLPQEFGVYPKISAQDLLNHIAVLKGILNNTERRKQVEGLLNQTNLYAHRKKAVSSFSGGMRQRFGIALALLGNPQLIIVDEPTAGLDPEERNRFHNLLSEIGEQIIVILSTHIVEDVSDLCPQMAILNDGEIVCRDSPKTLMKQMQGKVWRKTIRKELLNQYESSHLLISSKLVMGERIIHVYANEKPGEDFYPVSVQLEDVYFHTLKLQSIRKEEVAC